MGWGRYLLLGSLGQQLDIEDQKAEIGSLRFQLSRGRSSGDDVDPRLEQLQAENDELRLYLFAVVRLLVAKNVVTMDDVRQVVAAVDAEDGSADGKYTGPLA